MDQALDSLLCIKEDCDSVHLENDPRRWILYQYLPHLTEEEPQAQQGEGTGKVNSKYVVDGAAEPSMGHLAPSSMSLVMVC